MHDNKFEVVMFLAEDGECPFDNWLRKLKDIRGRALIRKRINRLRLGCLGDSKVLGGKVYELRIFFGPGYRIYFGRGDKRTIVLLYGGNKSSQARDISIAKKYWKHYIGGN